MWGINPFFLFSLVLFVLFQGREKEGKLIFELLVSSLAGRVISLGLPSPTETQPRGRQEPRSNYDGLEIRNKKKKRRISNRGRNFHHTFSYSVCPLAKKKKDASLRRIRNTVYSRNTNRRLAPKLHPETMLRMDVRNVHLVLLIGR